MKIFEIEGSLVRPTKEILLISPFKEIWEQDKSSKKQQAIKEFSYIEFLCSPRESNPYSGYQEKKRKEKLKEEVIKNVEWEESDLVKQAITKYHEWLDDASPSWRFYMSVRKSIEKTRQFLEDVNLDERNDRGTPVFKITDVIRAQKECNSVLKSLNEMEERVRQEIFESVKTKSGKQINPLER